MPTRCVWTSVHGMRLSLCGFIAFFCCTFTWSVGYASSEKKCSIVLNGLVDVRVANLDETPLQREYREKFLSEFEPMAQAKWSKQLTNEWFGILADHTGGPEKIAVLKELGFEEKNSVVTAPRYSELVKNYLRLVEYGSPEKTDPILPALVYVRRGARGAPADYQLVTPGVDPFPNEPGFYLLTAAEMFNIPFRATLAGLKRGRFPLLEESHDVAHEVSFVMNQEYASRLVQVSRQVEAEKFPIGFSRRLFYIAEYLALGDPEKVSELRNILKAPNALGPTDETSFLKYKNFFKNLPRQELWDHAKNLITHYESFIRDYGGGVLRTFEKRNQIDTEMNSRFPDGEAHSLLIFLGRQRNELSAMMIHSMGGPMVAHLVKLLSLSELTSAQFEEVVNRNRLLAQRFRKDPPEELNGDRGAIFDQPLLDNAQDSVNEYIALQVARMEYAIWMTATRLPEKVWIEEGLQLTPPKNSQIAPFIRDLFGESSFIYSAFAVPH